MASYQHDRYLPFWLSGFVKLIMLLLHVLFAVAEINIANIAYSISSQFAC